MLTHQHQTIEEVDEDRMSSQEEQPVHDEPKKTMAKRIVGCWQIGLKILELCFCILCISLIIDPLRKSRIATEYLYQLLLISTAFIGYLIITSVSLFGRLFGDRLPFKTSAMFSLVGLGLNLAAGCLILSDREKFAKKYIFYPNMYMLDMMTISGIFSIFNTILFSIDAFFTLKLQYDL